MPRTLLRGEAGQGADARARPVGLRPAPAMRGPTTQRGDGMWSLGFRVKGMGFGVEGFGYRVEGLKSRV